MAFTIEFQPVGIRVLCSEAITVLDAARQAGIQLRADCGGQGSCGKCIIQWVDSKIEPPSSADLQHLSSTQLKQGYRLACATLIERDAKFFIPPQSIPSGQILQTDGETTLFELDAPIQQTSLQVAAASLNDLNSDLERLRLGLKQPQLWADLSSLQSIARLLRTNNWRISVIQHGDRILHACDEPLQPLAGLAVDVGSTKLACYLTDLESGRLLAAKGTPNPQVMYGEDIMARLAHAQKGKDEEKNLQTLVIDAINQTAEELCAQIGMDTEKIADTCLVGNTAMQHFLLNLPSAALAVSPFVPVTSSPLWTFAHEIGLKGLPQMSVYVPPVIAGFVGSDHLAFLLASGFGQDKRTRLGIDIGTNTEIALQKGTCIVSVSTASGPAFEGAHIQHGMRAAPGAIEHVRLSEEGRVELDVIGNIAPVGICGSGILDAVGELRRLGLLNQRGRLIKDHPLVNQTPDGNTMFLLSIGQTGNPAINLSQRDIDQVLLAKGAIRAGIDILMDHLKVKPEEIEEIIIAGAFGSFMLPSQAVRIGMLPDIPLERIHAVGNAAGAGARMLLLSNKARQQAEALARRIEYLELTLYPDFELFYARAIQA